MISSEAQALYAQNDVIDLHIDSYIWTRVFGYDLRKRHGRGPFGARAFYQVDLPRIREAKIKGGVWSITTNPFRTSQGRLKVFDRNLKELRSIFESVPDQVKIVRTAADYFAARAAGKHAAWIAIQGGNAWDADLDAIAKYADVVSRVTLVHLLFSTIARTSTPVPMIPSRWVPSRGLSDFGREYVERMNAARIFVDLAHIDRKSFFDVVEVHDPSLPILVSHTGVSGVNPHWRNLDDEQLRAVARTGGVVGIIYQSSFLGDGFLGGRAETVIRHLEHVIKTVGEDYAALGSDWDGVILPPRDMATCLELPYLVQLMLDRKWSSTTIQKVLGGNYLRALQQIRTT